MNITVGEILTIAVMILGFLFQYIAIVYIRVLDGVGQKGFSKREALQKEKIEGGC